VYLVGAGPGDPGLLTVRAVELIASADAILYDRLIPESALANARADAITEYAGKGPRGDSKLQGEIEDRMVSLAQEGKSVVRLKGGDPFVFGRGGEEAATLVAAAIPFEIVPGVTAGIAASAYAGVPVTHRDHAAAVAFITGQENPTKDEETIDWHALAAFPGTLVFYMGVKNLPRIAEQLIANGRDAAEPVAVIAQGTTSSQRTVTGRLVDIADHVAQAGIAPPALTVIGSVVSERENIEWFETRPLFGRSVAVTRARAQASKLVVHLRELGAKVVEAPTIRVEPHDDDAVRGACNQLGSFDLICLTSTNGARFLMDAIGRDGRDARALAGVTVAAVGDATAASLRERGVSADIIPERSTAEGLLETLADQDLAGKRVLLPVGSRARPVLAEGLRERGAEVQEVIFYDTILEPIDEHRSSEVTDSDYITFASGSAVHSLIESLGGTTQLEGAQLVSIGPATSAALREHDLEPSIEAEQHDLDGLIDALLSLAATR
jgi:uroporphyrinogen III methyltransferase/synthase